MTELEKVIEYVEKQNADCSDKEAYQEDFRRNCIILEALGEKQARDNPQPLTAKKVNGMCGKPLYVVPLDGDADWEKHWSIMHYDSVTADSINVKSRMYFLYEKDYGTTWIAYDYEPKEKI